MSEKTRKVLKTIITISKALFFVGLLAWSIYVWATGKYHSMNFFLKVFAAPFAEITLSISRAAGGYAWVGLIVSMLVHSLTYGLAFINLKDETDKMVKHSGRMKEISRIPNKEEKSKKIHEFLDETDVYILAPFELLLLMPFYILSYQGIMSVAFKTEEFTTLNHSFLWFDLTKSDPFFILPALVLIVLVIVPLVIHFVKKKKGTLEEMDPFAVHFERITRVLYIMLAGVCCTSAALSVFLIFSIGISFVVNKGIKMLEGKENKNEQPVNETSK